MDLRNDDASGCEEADNGLLFSCSKAELEDLTRLFVGQYSTLTQWGRVRVT